QVAAIHDHARAADDSYRVVPVERGLTFGCNAIDGHPGRISHIHGTAVVGGGSCGAIPATVNSHVVAVANEQASCITIQAGVLADLDIIGVANVNRVPGDIADPVSRDPDSGRLASIDAGKPDRISIR